jgi:hypothetical protein
MLIGAAMGLADMMPCMLEQTASIRQGITSIIKDMACSLSAGGGQ